MARRNLVNVEVIEFDPKKSKETIEVSKEIMALTDKQNEHQIQKTSTKNTSSCQGHGKFGSGATDRTEK